MSVTLKSFSEDVELNDPKNPKCYLVFDSDGEEFRVPVGADAVRIIMQQVLKTKKPVIEQVEQVEQKEPPVESAADDDDELYDDDRLPQEEYVPSDEDLEDADHFSMNGRAIPESEDDVPSL